MVGRIRQLSCRNTGDAECGTHVVPAEIVRRIWQNKPLVVALDRRIFGAIFTVPRLGAATVLALMVVGQMLGSLAFDQFGLFGIPHRPTDATRLIGAAFLVVSP